ncbi:DUF1828 domain-containing protein [Sphingobium sp. ba1]|uniref:DUF1828 domain-containing protein n=1 Tax=Sphingobium sp. ba1 TaxID=1522072 RepID=UPI000560AD1F|nr:DUF1828 domain-containing protein [Sphingobium sp. ba1]
MIHQALEKELCATFCAGLEVHPVPSGYAVSSVFQDNSGDKIAFYLVETPDGFRIEDDGDYLSTLIASDIRIDSGSRGTMLDAILADGGAYWDRETFEIRSSDFPREQAADRSVRFLSSLIRVRDLALVTRERVRSAFREDFLAAIGAKFGDSVEVFEGIAPANDLGEFPADIVLKPRNGGRTGAVYLVNNTDKLNEALLAWRELEDYPGADVAIMAVLEDREMKSVSRMKWQRAQNRHLPMPVFRGDEGGMLNFIRKELRMQVA